MVSALITVLIYAIALGLIVWLCIYLLDTLPVPQPFNRVARVLVIAIAVLMMILLLLSLVDSGPLRLPRL